MDIPKYKTALIVGAGEGLSASLARVFAREKIAVALAALAPPGSDGVLFVPALAAWQLGISRRALQPHNLAQRTPRMH